MFYELIKKICDKWYQSEDCKIKNIIYMKNYINFKIVSFLQFKNFYIPKLYMFFFMKNLKYI